MKKFCALFCMLALFAAMCFCAAYAAEDVALYLDSTKIQLTGDTECNIRVTANAVMKKDLPFVIEYDG